MSKERRQGTGKGPGKGFGKGAGKGPGKGFGKGPGKGFAKGPGKPSFGPGGPGKEEGYGANKPSFGPGGRGKEGGYGADKPSFGPGGKGKEGGYGANKPSFGPGGKGKEGGYGANKPSFGPGGRGKDAGYGPAKRKEIAPRGKGPGFGGRDKAPTEAKPEGENTHLRVGRNPVLEALKAGSPVNKLLIAKGSREGSIREIIGLAKDLGVVIQEVERIHLDELIDGRNHQGVIAYVSPKDYVEIDDILALAKERGEEPLVLLLDEVEDPHNLGSILRSAEGAGAHGVIIPKRRSVSLTETVAKASAGAIEYVPVARVSNLTQAMEELKAKGLWIGGADGEAEEIYTERDLKGPLALVIGSEGKGLSRLIKERCDFLVKLPMQGRINSLNAAVAGAILLYEVVRQRTQG